MLPMWRVAVWLQRRVMANSAPDVVQIRVAVRTAIRRPRPCALPRPCISPSAHQVFLPFQSLDCSQWVHRPKFRASSTRNTDGCQLRFAQVMSYSHEGISADSVSIGNGKFTMEADFDCTSSTTGASYRASGAQSAAFPFRMMNDIVQAQERVTGTSATERRLPMLVPVQLSGLSSSAPLLPRRIILLASGPTVSYGTDSSQVCTQAPSICSASSPRRPATRRR